MEQVRKKKRGQESNRLIISDKVQEKANGWLSQINTEFKGMLTIRRNDLLNTILEELDDTLTTSLLESIRQEKLTDKQKAKWIYQKFLDAEKTGQDVDLNLLIKTAQGTSRSRKKSRKTKNIVSQKPLNTEEKETFKSIEKPSNTR